MPGDTVELPQRARHSHARAFLWIVGRWPGHADAVPPAVLRSPGHRWHQGQRGEQYVEIRTINGTQATNREGAAQYLNRSLISINTFASPKKRAQTGWPEPIARQARHHWYALADLDSFRDTYLAPKEESGRPRVRRIPYAPDPTTMITDAQFRALIQVAQGTWNRYVADSKTDWQLGRDGYLPRPDHTESVQGGERRSWLQHRVAAWINNRPGTYPKSDTPTNQV